MDVAPIKENEIHIAMNNRKRQIEYILKDPNCNATMALSIGSVYFTYRFFGSLSE